jgi:anti-sigma-K factor RskA
MLLVFVWRQPKSAANTIAVWNFAGFWKRLNTHVYAIVVITNKARYTFGSTHTYTPTPTCKSKREAETYIAVC